MKFSQTVRKNSKILYISIPKSVIDLLKIENGDFVSLDIVNVYKKDEYKKKEEKE